MLWKERYLKIELFSVPGCTACVTVRGSLKIIAAERADLDIEEVDLSVNPERGAPYRILACPALVIDGKLELLGAISPRRLRRLLDAIDLKGAELERSDKSVLARSGDCCTPSEVAQ